MSGKEVLHLIRKVDGCSLSKAINQLQSAISDGAVMARLPDPKDPSRNAIFPLWADTLPKAPQMTSPGVRQFPSREQWRAASLGANGTVQFFGSDTPRYQFEVVRAHVERVWPDNPRAPIRTHRLGRKPHELNETLAFLGHNYPKGVPEKIKVAALCAELKEATKASVSERTMGRALAKHREELAKSRKI
jgi:hypothetical protein